MLWWVGVSCVCRVVSLVYNDSGGKKEEVRGRRDLYSRKGELRIVSVCPR